MTLVWSWEEMDYGGEEEPRLLPDLYIPDGTTCAYCNLTERESRKCLVVLCSQCDRAAHYACASDCNPDPYETDPEYPDFVCGNCLNWTREDAAKHAAQLTADAPLAVPISVADDGDLFLNDERYLLP